MDSNRIKKLATGIRASLMAEVSARLDRVLAEGSPERLDMPNEVKGIEAAIKELGRERVVEANAYTWFNRLCALRFMDANGYTPAGIVTPKGNSTQPEILADAMQGVFDSNLGFDRLVRDMIAGLISGSIPSANPMEAAYEAILSTVCKHYANPMPYLFKDGADASRLLMPQGLLSEGSLLRRIVTEMDEEACESVEVLGWLYQFYIAEKKVEVFASKKKRGAAEIPAATQLFTPNWIVRYMTENSLGRLWMLNNPSSSLREIMEYYIEGDTPEAFLKVYSPEEITVLDPACGSGHILVYAFDLLYAIYEEEGYLPEEIPAMILTKNLFGFEIDQRAAEIAKFALEMKARAKDSKFFERCIETNITVLDSIRFSEGELEEAGMLAEHAELLEAFAHLDEIGSLYVPGLSDDIFIDNAIANIQQKSGMYAKATVSLLQQMKDMNGKLSHKFSVVIANPPYMPVSSMEPWAKKWVEQHYPDEKSDLFACFVKRNLEFSVDDGQLGFMTPFVWMFISSYERLRRLLIDDSTITSLVQLEYSGFEGATVPICTFTVQKLKQAGYMGSYIRLSDFVGAVNQAPKTLEAISNPDCGWFYRADAEDFKQIPGSPIAYWASANHFLAFQEANSLGELSNVAIGMGTGKNDWFVREWWEIAFEQIEFDYKTIEDIDGASKKYYPYNKGGHYRLWYGNLSQVIWFDKDGQKKMFELSGHRENGGWNYYFKQGLTWSFISSSKLGIRYLPYGCLFDVAGSSIFPVDVNRDYLLGFLSTTTAYDFLSILNPTMNFQAGNLKSLPVLVEDEEHVEGIVQNSIQHAKQDWNAFETSWDFEQHPLLPQDNRVNTPLEDIYSRWAVECRDRFDTLKKNEEELNRVFARIYNMEGVVATEVPDDKVSVRLADKERDIKSLISYGVGCIFGRYSADKPGIILADQGSTVSDFTTKVPNATFTIDKDGILPVLDGEWFEDDIVVEFKSWLKSTYGSETLQANIAFIEDALGEDLRTYFVKHFYDDHINTYKKRPIYWLFSSPKRSFNALVYLHRYDEGTVGDILTGYLREYVSKLNASVASLETSDRATDRKQADKYRNMVKELEEWERNVIYPMAHERIAIDLDDGVKVNYNKFPHALRKVTGLSEWK
ncbi:BREX-1 system adenine-specific DNA-methyltransferase PglX [Adlercreutzia agrestimuris]|uniref:BREX-1 system adenine-specific DNA-methyltransferase PglX n=1 Tax=Adlercreutzia agrestimuris TaxID=2941324 RepID=UPI00203B4104|nr:BREX-1 system adenine-specific DNA-methyltransferase PglX [Adlercreutzia agrestimuris]